MAMARFLEATKDDIVCDIEEYLGLRVSDENMPAVHKFLDVLRHLSRERVYAIWDVLQDIGKEVR